MSTNVEIQFLPRSVGGSKRKGDLRISKFDSKRRHGGGRVRGHGQGCGGRGAHHSSSNRHDPYNGWFHGLGLLRLQGRFSGEEFDKAGRNGRLYLFNKGNSDKDTCHTQNVQQGVKDDGKELALVPYSREATVNNNLGGGRG